MLSSLLSALMTSSISKFKNSKSKTIVEGKSHNKFSVSRHCLSKMATARKERLSVTSTEAQHAVIYSFWKSGKRATDIHRHLSESFGQDNALSLRTIQLWCKAFREGRTTLDRDPGQGRPTEPSTASLQGKIEGILDEDARVMVRELEDLTGASRPHIWSARGSGRKGQTRLPSDHPAGRIHTSHGESTEALEEMCRCTRRLRRKSKG